MSESNTKDPGLLPPPSGKSTPQEVPCEAYWLCPGCGIGICKPTPVVTCQASRRFYNWRLQSAYCRIMCTHRMSK